MTSKLEFFKNNLPLADCKGNPCVSIDENDLVECLMEYHPHEYVMENPKIIKIRERGYLISNSFWINGWFYLLIELGGPGWISTGWIWQIDERYIDDETQWKKLVVRRHDYYPRRHFTNTIRCFHIEEIVATWNLQFGGDYPPCILESKGNHPCFKCGKFICNPFGYYTCEECALTIFRELYGEFLLRCYQWSHRQGSIKLSLLLILAKKHEASKCLMKLPKEILRAIIIEFLES